MRESLLAQTTLPAAAVGGYSDAQRQGSPAAKGAPVAVLATFVVLWFALGGGGGCNTPPSTAPEPGPVATFEVLKSFELSDGPGTVVLEGPEPGLVVGEDGSVTGATFNGGPASAGTLFRIEADGTFRRLHAFDGVDGYPEGLILWRDGAVYGLIAGQDSFNRAIFRIDAAGAFSLLHAFEGPACCTLQVKLTVGSDGSLYGTEYDGSSAHTGTLFRIDAAGRFTTLRSLAGIGGLAKLLLGSDGALYGSVLGNTWSEPDTFFRLDTTGAFTPLHDFDKAEAKPSESELLLASDGAFYGTSRDMGEGRATATLFRVDRLGELTVLRSWARSDLNPPTGLPLVEGGDGALYSPAGHTVFRYRAGVYTTLLNLG